MVMLMTPAQRTELEQQLAGIHPASIDLVLDALHSERKARTAATTHAASLASANATTAVPALARRLVDVENEYALMRTTLARILHECQTGDDYVLSDLTWELSQAGLSVQPEIDALAAAADAEARETLR